MAVEPTTTLDRMAKNFTYSVERAAWRNMIHRCTQPKNKAYSNYGGRGISVCDAWLNSFDAFLRDVGPKPSPELSLDRLDNDKGYEPGNCAWRTRAEQQANRRSRSGVAIYNRKGGLRVLTHNGVTLRPTEWAEITGLSTTTIHQRIREGLPPDEVLSKERRKRHSD